jgi:NAD+ kinase
MKVTIFGRSFDSSFKPYIIELFDNLEKHHVEILLFQPLYDFLNKEINYTPQVSRFFTNHSDCPEDADFMISIGGDGTFLECISYLSNFNIPVVGLNSGRLGFLANISKNEISAAFDAIYNNEYELEYRTLIEVQTGTKIFDGFNFALNEATIQKKDSAMITIDAYLDGEYLNTYWTDGLIVSTPTGSTAYSLSTGGPLVEPESNNLIIAPIASHNLTVRPIVIPDNKSISLKVHSRSDKFLVTVDNRTGQMGCDNEEIVIKKAGFRLKMLRFPFNNFYSTLRNKLMWGLDKRN